MSTDRRSLNQIETDLDENRQRMGQTLDILQKRLSTDNLFERGRAYLCASGSEEFVTNLRLSVTQNPVPLSLVGIGMIWLITSGSDSARRAIAERTPDHDGHTSDSDSGTLGDKTSEASESARSAARSVRGSVDKAFGNSRAGLGYISKSTRQGASSAGNATRRGADRALDGMNYMRHEQPVVTAALGLAFGAVLAASLPRSASENQAMGAARDEFVDSVRETGEEKAAQAKSVAESAAGAASEAAKEEADKQGLRHSDH